MIEIKKNGRGMFEVWIDGVKLRKDDYSIRPQVGTAHKDKNLALYVQPEKHCRRIAEHRFSDLPAEVTELSLPYSLPILKSYGKSTHINVIRSVDGKGSAAHFEVSLIFLAAVESWKNPWSMEEYKKEFSRALRSDPNIDIEWVEYYFFASLDFNPTIKFKLPAVTDYSLTLEDVLNRYADVLEQLHERVEASLFALIRTPDVDHIVRSIEFPPEYYHSGITILSYFTDVLRHKNLSEQVKVSIEQSGLSVRLVIESPTGQRELIERTLETYALVVTGKQPIDTLTTDPYEVAELKSQLRLASAQIENQRDLLALKESAITDLRSEVDDTKASIRRLERRSDEDRARFMGLIEGLASHNKDLASGFREIAEQAVRVQNKTLSDALDNLYKVIERGVREEDREEVIQNLMTIQREDPGVFRRVYDVLVVGAMSGAAGNYLYSWLQFIAGIVPK